jgi:hypothetical protein
MKIITLNQTGTRPATAKLFHSENGSSFYVVTHGKEARGCWQVRYPLGTRDFPPDPALPKLTLAGDDYRLVSLKKKDLRGNEVSIIGRANPDPGRFLVFWDLMPPNLDLEPNPNFKPNSNLNSNPNFNVISRPFTANYSVSGDVEIIAEGATMFGPPARRSHVPCPVLLVRGACTLRWWYMNSGTNPGALSEYFARLDPEIDARFGFDPEWHVGAVEDVAA